MLRPFRLLRPATLSEALSMLQDYGDDARLYAGGTALLMLMHKGLLRVRAMIDIKRISGLDHLNCDGDGTLVLGAAVTHRRLETSALVRQRFPLIVEMESEVANIRVRNVGTVGGNLALAEPQSDPATLFLILDAKVVLQSHTETREVALKEFFTGSFETVLRPTEIMCEIRVHQFPEEMKGAYLRWGKLAWPSVAVGVAVRLGENKNILASRVAVGCVGPVPRRLTELEESLSGMELNEAYRLLANSGGLIQKYLNPVSDLYGSAEYKLHLAKVLLQRALRRAAEGNHA